MKRGRFFYDDLVVDFEEEQPDKKKVDLISEWAKTLPYVINIEDREDETCECFLSLDGKEFGCVVVPDDREMTMSDLRDELIETFLAETIDDWEIEFE